MLHLFPGRLEADITGQYENNVGRTVVLLEPLVNILERRAIEIIHRANDRVSVRMIYRIDACPNTIRHT